MENEPKFDIVKAIVNNTPKTIIIGAVAILVIAAGIGYWYWSKSKQAPPLEEVSTLGSEIFEKTQNQLQGQVPDTNPFKDQKNPFDSIYQNPFE